MKLPTQTIRDVVAVIFIAATVSIFYWSALKYLTILKNPLPMQVALVFSLLLSCFYELKNGASRVAFVSVATTCLFFSVAPSLADIYREYYVMALHDIAEIQASEPQFMGSTTEYVSALNNPAVGVGSCFALAIATLRLPFQRIVNKALGILLIEPKQQSICATCGQTIAGIH